MGLSINTNVMSLNAQRNLGNSQNALSKSMQRLSSGLRINSAKDDAAGLGISDRMTSQIRGLNQAVRNSNDGISLAQTAEGALQETTNILQRMRELAVQSANDTNSASDRSSLQAEVNQLKQEISRIAETTSFNGRNLLDGSMTNAQFQVGANSNQTISFGIQSAEATDLGNNSLKTTNREGIEASTLNGSSITVSNLASATEEITLTKNDGSTVTAAAGATAAALGAELVAEGAVASYSNSVEISTTLTGDIGDTATIAYTNGDGDAGEYTLTMSSTASVSSTETTNGAVEQLEVQTHDLAGLTGTAGDVLTFTFADGETLSIASVGTITGDTEIDTAFTNGTYTDSANRQWTYANPGGDASTITLTQVAGSGSPAGATTSIVMDNTSGGGTNTNPTSETTTVGTPGIATQAEIQSLDLSSVTVGAGDVFTMTIEGEDISYTNNTNASLSGADLVSAIEAQLGTSDVGGGVGNYTFAANGSTATTLDVSQAAGNEAPVAGVITTQIGSVTGAVTDPSSGVTANYSNGTLTLSSTDGNNITVGAVAYTGNGDGSTSFTEADGTTSTTGTGGGDHAYTQRATATFTFDSTDNVISAVSDGTSLGVAADEEGLTGIGLTDTSAKNNVAEQTLTIVGPEGSSEVEISENASANAIARQVNAESANTGVSASARTEATIGNLSADGTVSFTLQGTNDEAVNITATVTTDNLSSLAQAINDQAGNTGITAVLNSDNSSIALTQSSGYDVKIGDFQHSDAGVAGTDATVQITGNEGIATVLTDVAGTDSAAELAANTTNTDSTVVGGEVSFSSSGSFNIASDVTNVNGSLFNNSVAGAANTSTLSSIDQVDITTVAGSADAIDTIDGAIAQIDTIRGDLGAIQNRFESTIANLSNVSENLSAARSRILDADIAQETSAMTKNNILQQAGVSILAQANQAPQLALSLLG